MPASRYVAAIVLLCSLGCPARGEVLKPSLPDVDFSSSEPWLVDPGIQTWTQQQLPFGSQRLPATGLQGPRNKTPPPRRSLIGRRIPERLGTMVLASFTPGKANEAAREKVSAAVATPTPMLEAIGSDPVTLNGRRWGAVVRRRAHILRIVDTILDLPEKETDIGKVSLTLALDTDPGIDAEHYSKELGRVVDRARAFIPPAATPDYRIRALNTLFYKKMGIDYDKADFMGKKLANRYVYGVLKTNKGTCVNLATFYIAVAQRLGYPIYAVAAPQHLFARYVDPNLERQNIDPSGKGGWDPDEEYIRKTGIPFDAMKNGVYLRTMTHKELAAEMIADHGAYYYGQVLKDYPTAIAILEKALKFSPRASEYWHLVGQLHKKWGAQEYEPSVRETKYIKALYFMQKAKRLGIGEPLEENYWKQPQPKKEPRGPGV